ncbi:NHLP leader peptide family RiPP precursor [Nostoc sp. DSM 114161]|jgi:hypothetical protein|uniref:NHLP leader peptide family RiPP precursor n=1 Tax=Nostoc sp. DSM 114161 TaxID=3440143 RepID=UPI004045BC5B
MFEIKAQLLTQAVQDSYFRNRLIADPLTVAAEYGWNIPTQTQITVVEETPSHYYLVLPALGTQDLANQTPENSDVNSTAHILEIEVQLLARAAQDCDFRTRLIADPKTVMAQKGLNFPTNIQVSVLEETANRYYLVLPALDFSELETNRDLSDAELELVAGGSDTQNHSWTGCASGQSGCVATKGCDAAASTVAVTIGVTAALA